MKKLILLTALLTSPAMADTLNQSGVGNIANQDSGNISNYNSGNTNSGNSSAKAYGGNAYSNQHQSQDQNQHQSATSSVKGSGNSANTNTIEAQKRNPASSASSAFLTASEDTCMGSSAVGGQGVGFGVSFGSTWKDGDCVRRKDARELHNMGQKAAAIALMCQNEDVANAMAAAGTPCVDVSKIGALSPASHKETKYAYPSQHTR